MINSEVFIIKRDGKKETFSLDKIKNAIAKAFLSVGSFATQDVITTVLSRVSVSDGMNVEEIQNQVEVALMAEHYYSVAKAYMLYRQKHLEDREVRDKLKFLLDYCDASNPATGSKYDANANVENKNIATLIGELPKSNFIRLNRRLLNDGTFSNLSKRELLQVSRQRAKLEKNLGSIADMARLPVALFVVDVMKEHIAVKEANRLGIPVFGIVDTNSDPKNVDYVIPANDDAKDSVDAILTAVCGAIAEALEERKAEKADDKAAAEQKDQPKKKAARKDEAE